MGFINFGVKELILVLLIVLVIFGPKKLPEIGRSFGEMLSNFRKGTQNSESTDDKGEAKPKSDENDTASAGETPKDSGKSSQE